MATLNKKLNDRDGWVCGGDNDTSGDIHFHIVWRPLTDNGFVEVV